MSDKMLILENDPTLPDELDNYIYQQKNDYSIFTGLKDIEDKIIIDAVDNHDIIVMQSTFSDKEQVKQILGIASLYTDKEYRIISTAERLHYILYNMDEGFHNPFKFIFKHNTIKEISYQTKVDNKKSNHFFKSYLYYFDEVELYYNEEQDAFFPERPLCFFNNELEPVYKYKPEWTLV